MTPAEQHLHLISVANTAAEAAKVEWTRLKREAADAKKDYDEKVAELHAVISGQTLVGGDSDLDD